MSESHPRLQELKLLDAIQIRRKLVQQEVAEGVDILPTVELDPTKIRGRKVRLHGCLVKGVAKTNSVHGKKIVLLAQGVLQHSRLVSAKHSWPCNLSNAVWLEDSPCQKKYLTSQISVELRNIGLSFLKSLANFLHSAQDVP